MTALVVAGAAVFLILGVAHAALTLRSSPSRGPLTPTNPDVRSAMTATTGLGLAPEVSTTLWRTWVGFNLSHALGIITIAGTIMFHAIDDLEAVADQAWFLVLTCGLPSVYLTLSIRYWFARPTRGIIVGGLLLAIGTLGTAFG
jgi:hypothetical protein